MTQPNLQALRARVVTMDAARTVLPDHVVYIRDSDITAVQPASEPAPAGFEHVAVINTHGTLYPGLMDLHNHLAYNVLPLWPVPRRYDNRDQWGSHPDYRRLISGPMTVLGKTEGYPAAIARYTECKCLLGGVTTSQGIRLNSQAGMSTFYRGFLRNPEVSDGPGLPAAQARIADVEASDRERFRERLERETALLLHLSEGVDEDAREHFLALVAPGGKPALAPSLVGIHCVALQRADFGKMHAHGASMVWSPLSNLLLYGDTADIAAARDAGLRIALGADWSPSGSKNLLGEMKVARVVARERDPSMTDADIVAMATCDAAAMLKWEGEVGSVEVGKRADLLVIAGEDATPYAQLLEATEADIALVLIDGIPRYGLPKWMGKGAHHENVKVDGKERTLDLADANIAPLQPMALSKATELLEAGMADLVELAKRLARRGIRGMDLGPEWTLQLEEEEPSGVSLRTRFDNVPRAFTPKRALGVTALAASQPLSELVGPMTLDRLTAIDDPDFVHAICNHANMPVEFRAGLKKAFQH